MSTILPPQTSNPAEAALYDILAPFYDLEYQGLPEFDVALYRNFARRCGDSLLELGVGTGRLALPLAREGLEVTGVDISPRMLAIAQAKLKGDLAQRVHLVPGDMRKLHLGRHYSLAVIALDTFMHLTTVPDQVQTLQAIRRHLTTEGLLIIDLSNPLAGNYTQGEGELVLAWVRQDPATGHRVMKLESVTTDAARQLRQVTFIYDAWDHAGLVRRSVMTFPLRYFYRSEMELLLCRAGFGVEAVYGSYDLEPYSSQSPRLILVATNSQTEDG